MPTPSLLIVPARFKSGKLYSQIPTSGAGDFTVTRATAATRVNASGYIESVASGIPRLDYFASGGTVGCPALLVEPSGSNSMLYSQAINSWTKSELTITDNFAISPDGTQNASYIQQTTGGNIVNLQSAGVSLVSGQAQSVTFFAKAAQITSLTLRFGTTSLWAGSVRPQFTLNLTNGAVTLNTGSATLSSQNFGNGWYRYSIVTPATIASGQTTIQTVTNTVFSPNSGDGFYLWGVQWEQNTSTPTSYIPTTTAAVTRNADVVSVSGAVSGSIGQTEGTIYAEFFVDFNNRDADIFSVDGGSTSDGFFMSIRSSSVVQLIVRTASANALIFQRAGTFPTGVNKLAVAYKNGDFAICLNGTTVQTNTSSITMPSVSINRASLCRNGLYTLNQQIRIRAAALYTTRLTNAELAALTSP